MRVTQKQIADNLGVSRVLVSYALGGYGRVGDDMRCRIIDEANRLGYNDPNNAEARALLSQRFGRRTRTGIVAVLFNSRPGDAAIRMEPFFSPLFDGVEKGARELGLQLSFCPVATPSLPRLIEDRGVDGVINVFAEKELLKTIASIGLPSVTLDRLYPDHHGVVPDVRDGVRQAVRHLVDLGHRRIGYVGHRTDFWSGAECVNGYLGGLTDHGLSVDETLLEATVQCATREGGAEGIARVLERTSDFTGLICYNDMHAMGAIRELQSRGIQVPHDVSVVGFDDISQQYEFQPSLTSVDFAGEEIGRRAVRMLGELMDQDNDDGENLASAPVRHEIVPVKLNVRKSTALCQQHAVPDLVASTR